MLSGVMLAWYGSYTPGQFGTLLDQWESMGVFSYMLPFLLIFAIVYGILSKLNLFGDAKNKSINAIIALATALMTLQFEAVPIFFSDIFPRLGIALAGVLVFIILLGLFGDSKNKSLLNILMWGSFGVAVLIVLQSLDIFAGGYTGDYLLKFIPYSWIPWILLIVLVAIIVASARSPSQDSISSHLSRAFGGLSKESS